MSGKLAAQLAQLTPTKHSEMLNNCNAFYGNSGRLRVKMYMYVHFCISTNPSCL